MRRAMLLLAPLAVACGGDDPAGPSNPFPSVAGVYAFTATYDELPSAVASATGTLTITQASRQVGTLGGTVFITSNVGGEISQITGLNNPSITTASAVTFSVGQSSSVTWVFDGTLSNGTISGRHTLGDGISSFSGNWSATRTGASAAIAAREMPAMSLAEMNQALIKLSK